MPQAHPHALVRWTHTLWHTHRPLTLSAALTALLGIFFLAGIFLDARYITGAPAWLKPLKFSISISVYSLTLVWMLGFIQGRRRLVSFLAWLTLTMFAIEWIAIITQTVRGVPSHFNYTSALNAFITTGLMAVPIVALWIGTAVIAVLLLLQRFPNPVLAWSVRLGLLITLLGMAEGFLMTTPTTAQLSAMQAGQPMTFIGAHSVGTPDGGPGLPGIGWSTRGGDLRVGHFVGMHALQVLPFLAALLMRRRDLHVRQQLALLFTGAAYYLGLTVLVTWQALRAEPLTQPGPATLTVFAVLTTAAALVTAHTATRARHTARARATT